MIRDRSSNRHHCIQRVPPFGTGTQPDQLSPTLPPILKNNPNGHNYLHPGDSRPSSATASQSLAGVSRVHGTARFRAVFSENQATVVPTVGDEEPKSKIGLKGRAVEVGNAKWEIALDTLLYFPTNRTCQMLLENLNTLHDVWISRTIIRHCLNQLWNDFGHRLRENRSRDTVFELANEMFENSQHPIPSSDPEEASDTSWVNWFAGPRLRWEIIGILFAWSGMAFKHEQDWSPVFDLPKQQGPDRNASAITGGYIAKLSAMTVTVMDCGLMGTAFINASLYRQNTTREVTALSQFRAIIGTSYFHLDKCDSLFLGWPPRLEKRYCQIPQPLDIADEDLYGGKVRLAATLRRLDVNSWNIDKHISAVTVLRAVPRSCPIREEILRLSLSAKVVQTSTLFIAFLDWVRPTDNNSQLCKRCRTVVKRIIDAAIDAPLSVWALPQQVSSDIQIQLQDLSTPELQNAIDFHYDPAMIGLDDLEWMHTVDWTQRGWLEMGQDNLQG
ncbi:uncharacterized protein RAG0_12070 [Rhynchosporium agropyri]|uniref:Transcription factor domain-containing protein n=1 Tax=Rhynchosporium agropyri TaxID=914238 RepID=A0A1E1L704_9HELO|nr:uncharacterized protein RAG0_12070 [Rhynchosporium agropyri]